MCACVSVPVLSKNSVSTSASASIASSRRTSTPRRASAPAAASSADGAASDNAHGQVTISTATVTHTARDGSITDHAAPAIAASSSTPHRNGTAMRSAVRTSAGRCVSAPRISATTPSKRVSAPSRSTRIVTGAPRFRLPATTHSPGPRSTGRDSPVSSASSTCARPSINGPSVAKASPANTRTRSPMRNEPKGTGVKRPSASTRRTSAGSRAQASSSEAATRCCARKVSQRPTSRKDTNIVSESK